MCKIIFKIPSKIAFVIMLTFLIGCPGIGEPTGDSTIEIVNNSSYTIDLYWDTTEILKNHDPFDEESIWVIKPNGSKKMHDWWKQFFVSIYDMHLFIFDVQVLDTVPWDTIRKYEMYFTRIDFTKAKLDSLNWTITYP